jgi:hypothetical protein
MDALLDAQTLDGISETQICERITFYEQQVIALKHALNTRSVINKLPRELLALIFLSMLPTSWETSSIEFCSFISITRVCSHWRSVALDTPSLWTVLPCHTDRQTAEALQRAGDHTLYNVRLEGSQLFRPPPTSLIPRLLDPSRLGSLELTDLRPTCLDVCCQLLVQDLPQLSRLSIRFAQFSSDFTARNQDPFTPCERIAPQLKELKLFGWVSIMQGLHMPCLQNLELDGRRSNSLPLARLIDALRNLPALHTLVAQHIFPEDGDEHCDLAPVNLPLLERLTVIDHAAQSLCLLEHLRCPSLLGLALASDEQVHRFQQSPTTVAFLDRRGALLSRVTFNETDGSFRLTYKPMKNDRAHARPGYFSIYVPKNKETAVSAATAVVRLLSTSRVPINTLHIGTLCQPVLTTEVWLASFQHASTSIRELRVSRAAACNLAHALAARPAGPAEPFFLHKLEYLHISKVNFAAVRGGVTLGVTLKASLEARAKAGLHGLTLHIKCCIGVAAQDMWAAQKIVGVCKLEITDVDTNAKISSEDWSSMEY